MTRVTFPVRVCVTEIYVYCGGQYTYPRVSGVHLYSTQCTLQVTGFLVS